MAKLSKKERENIASLFNSIVVANHFIEIALREKDTDRFDLWWESKKNDTVTLYEKYGIELPTLKNYTSNAA